MFATRLTRENRPVAVSSAHWGDGERNIVHRPVAVSSAHWGEMAMASATPILFEAVFILLTGHVLPQKDTHNPPGFPTHNSTGTRILPQQKNESARQKTRM
jgi:hypothetical protein